MRNEAVASDTVGGIVGVPEGTGDAAGRIARKTFAGTSSAAVSIEIVANGAGETDSAVRARLTALYVAAAGRTARIR